MASLRAGSPCVPEAAWALGHLPPPLPAARGQQCPCATGAGTEGRQHVSRGQDFRTRGGPALTLPARAPSSPPQAHRPAQPQPIIHMGTPRDRAEPAQEAPAHKGPLRLGCFLDRWQKVQSGPFCFLPGPKQVATLGLSAASPEAEALSAAPALPTWPEQTGPRHSAHPAGQSGSGAELPFPGHPQTRRGPLGPDKAPRPPWLLPS